MLKKRITEEEVFNKVNDSDIFNHYFGAFDFSKCYPSVFRQDTHPSTGFYTNKAGRIIYNDLSTDEKLGAIAFVAKLFNITYHQAIEKIAKDFGVIAGVDNSQRIKPKRYRPAVKREKVYEVTKGVWKEEELDYWKQFGITREELKENNVFPCRELKINGFVIENPKNYLRFVYLINGLDGVTYIKVYSPHDPVYKWIGNVPKTELFGFKELPFKSKRLMITKGNKDRIIWKKFFTDVIAAQNESKGAIPEDICDFLNNTYDEIFINFDADKAGMEGAQYYIDTYGWKSITVPDIYYKRDGIKDFADLVKEKGLETFKNYLQWLTLLD